MNVANSYRHMFGHLWSKLSDIHLGSAKTNYFPTGGQQLVKPKLLKRYSANVIGASDD